MTSELPSFAAPALTALLALLGAGPPSGAGPSHDGIATTVLDSLVGSWSGEGTLLGRSAAFHMTWAAAGPPGVYFLTFRNAFRAEDGAETPVLTASALYRVAEDTSVEGSWFDSRGIRIELSGEAGPRRLRIEWSAPSESGVTVYDWLGGGVVEVVDSVRAAPGLREFGAARYRAVDP